MRQIFFKGQSPWTLMWHIGHYFCDTQGKHWILSIGKPQVEINPSTVCQYTGKNNYKGQHLFENDLVFSEIEEERGDIRIYFAVIWIKEWAGFIFLSYEEFCDYKDNGVQALENDYYSLESAEKMHYAGNILNKEDFKTFATNGILKELKQEDVNEQKRT